MDKTTDWNKRFDNIRLNKLEYEEVDINDILNDIHFETEDDKLLMKDIISNLESVVAEEIKNGKCVQIPYIGSLRKNPLKETLEKNRTNFRIAAKSLSKEGFKEHCSLVFKKKKDELRIQDYEKAKLKQIRKRHQKEFEQLYIDIGPAYANMYIFSKTLMKAVDFNEEFEDKIQELNRNEQS